MKLHTPPAALAVALAALCAGGVAVAQTRAPAPKAHPGTEAQLEAARADLERAARRVAELSRQLGREDGPIRIERNVVRKPVLGVLLAPDAQAGVRIAGVTPESGAAAAGLKSGDRITSIDGRQILGSNAELRVDNARKLLGDLDAKTPVKLAYVRDGRNGVASVTPKLGERIVVLPRGAGNFSGDVRFIEGNHGEFEIFADRMDGRLPGVAPRVRKEIMRLGPECKGEGKDCRFPALAAAFRWNGLNLATVDNALGRYFGTDSGVLVLSTGELAGLQAGDVIRKIDGKAVDSPRDAMDVLRDKPADALVLVEYLRDRKVASTRVRVPKAMPLRIPLPPPPPPAPPAAPKAPPPPPAPPAAAFEDGDVVIRRDVRIAYAPDAMPVPPDAPLPPAPPEAPRAIEEIEIPPAN